MTTDKPEEAMTFGELLALIGDQKRRLTVLENAFSSLIFCLDDRASQLLVHNLSLEAQNQNHDEQLQQHFARLAETLQKRGGCVVPETPAL
jgi:monomeric isocitrate dehydrogenase